MKEKKYLPEKIDNIEFKYYYLKKKANLLKKLGRYDEAIG